VALKKIIAFFRHIFSNTTPGLVALLYENTAKDACAPSKTAARSGQSRQFLGLVTRRCKQPALLRWATP
jgi:hypothetical protein